MNAIGEIGKLIVKYQYGIEVVLLTILAIIVLVGLIKLFMRPKKEKKFLDDISATVKDMSESMADIRDAQLDILSGVEKLQEDGDDRESACAGSHEAVSRAEVAGPEEHQSSEDIPADDEAAKAKDTLNAKADMEAFCINRLKELAEEEDLSHADKADGDELHVNEPPKKFFSRECGIDKKGNVYTEEQLIEQIN